jgi:hypothetical protein
VGRNLGGEHAGHHFVGDEEQDHAALGGGPGDGQHGKTVVAGPAGIFVLAVTDDDLQVAIAQVQRLGAALVAIADDGDGAGGQEGQVRMGVGVELHRLYPSNKLLDPSDRPRDGGLSLMIEGAQHLSAGHLISVYQRLSASVFQASSRTEAMVPGMVRWTRLSRTASGSRSRSRASHKKAASMVRPAAARVSSGPGVV